MRIITCIALIVLASIPSVAQTADTIIQKNLFDPRRGQVEAVDDTSGPVEEELPKNIPILDGIISIGSYQRVIFRYRDNKSHRMISGAFKKGDAFIGARILQILPNEVTIAFMGKKYKMTVDSKDKMKNVPKTSGSHGGRMSRAASSRGRSPQVVERKVTPRPQAPAVRTPPQRPGTVRRNVSTPFGSSRGASRTKRKPRTRKTTPF